MATVYLGLGTNLGKREDTLARAIVMLAEKVRVEQVSSIYETEPVGYADQPRFLNAVCRVSTDLPPEGLLRFAKSIEERLGRRPGFRNAPREIDIDILLYDGHVLHTPGLTIPHPRMAERAFVLVPLSEIAPGIVHPTSGGTIAELAAAVGGKEGVRRTGTLGQQQEGEGRRDVSRIG